MRSATHWPRSGGTSTAWCTRIGFAPAVCLGDDFLAAQWDDVAVAMHISAYSLKALADAFLPLMSEGGSFVGLRLRQPPGLARVQLDGCREVGAPERLAVSRQGGRPERHPLATSWPPGPIKTMAAKSIPGFAVFEDSWDDRAPLGWDVTDSEPVAKACIALLSDWFPATTGEIIHVDGGYHAMGA